MTVNPDLEALIASSYTNAVMTEETIRTASQGKLSAKQKKSFEGLRKQISDTYTFISEKVGNTPLPHNVTEQLGELKTLVQRINKLPLFETPVPKERRAKRGREESEEPSTVSSEKELQPSSKKHRKKEPPQLTTKETAKPTQSSTTDKYLIGGVGLAAAAASITAMGVLTGGVAVLPCILIGGASGITTWGVKARQHTKEAVQEVHVETALATIGRRRLWPLF